MSVDLSQAGPWAVLMPKNDRQSVTGLEVAAVLGLPPASIAVTGIEVVAVYSPIPPPTRARRIVNLT